MHPFTSANLAFAFVPASTVIATPHCVFTIERDAVFAVLQSRVHEVWARLFGSTLKDDLRYAMSDCFDTFAFPPDLDSLEKTGKQYYDNRAQLLLASSEGLTKTYNRFHAPDEGDEGIMELRRLHGLMDGAVLRAYGWDDLADSAVCGFGLDYLEVEDDSFAQPDSLWWSSAAEAHAFEGSLPASRKRLPWRYRWPDDFRDEVLARLLELNEQRHRDEVLEGRAVGGRATKKKTTKKKVAKKPNDHKKTDADSAQSELF